MKDKSLVGQMSSFKTFAQMVQTLKTENDYRTYFEKSYWGDEPVCPHCGVQSAQHYQLKQKGEFKGLRKCQSCRSRFTVRVGTMLEGSHLSYMQWAIAIYLVASHKGGLTSLKMAEELGITEKTGWYLVQRIRGALKPNFTDQMTEEILCDESLIGGLNKNRHKDKKVPHSQGRSYKDKKPVFGIMEREQSYVVQREHKVIPDKIVKEKIILKKSRLVCYALPTFNQELSHHYIKKHVEHGSLVVTDEFLAYNHLEGSYYREVVDHQRKEYVNERGFTTNPLEAAWPNLKGAIRSTHKGVMFKHLQRYADDFSFRYNHRDKSSAERFNFIVANPGPRIKYKDLIKSPAL